MGDSLACGWDVFASSGFETSRAYLKMCVGKRVVFYDSPGTWHLA